MNTRSVLSAGGSPVHRVTTNVRRTDDPTAPKNDPVPIVERYYDLAGFMHRTTAAPRGDRFLVGCVCGWHSITAIGGSMVAQTACQRHVLSKAEEMFELLEGKRHDARPEEET